VGDGSSLGIPRFVRVDPCQARALHHIPLDGNEWSATRLRLLTPEEEPPDSNELVTDEPQG
jgi:hypothetical protein